MKNKKNTNQTSSASGRRDSNQKSPRGNYSGEGRRSGDKKFSGEGRGQESKKFSGDKKSSNTGKFSGEKRYSADSKRSNEGKFSGEKRYSGNKENSGEKRNFGTEKFSGEKRYSADSKRSNAGKFSGEKRYSGNKENSVEKRAFDLEKFSGESRSSDDRKKSNPGKFSGEKKSYGKEKFSGDRNRSSAGNSFNKPTNKTYPKRTDNDSWEENKKPFTPKDSSSDKSSEEKSFSKKPWEKGDKNKDSKSFYTEKAPSKDDYEVVYRGRGRDEKPIYETVRKDPNNQKAKKSVTKFKKPLFDQPKDEKPSYNFEKFENRSKKDLDEEIRLNKYIANSGICSRREADELIKKGEIKVNGEVVLEMGYKVEKTDKVVYKGKVINPEKPVYILLNKPKDFITTTDDPLERKTVMQLIQNACDERVFPVGRLDRNTTGLLLFTNDGELAAKLSHPGSNIKKIYQVTLDKPLTRNDETAIMEGFTLEDGPVIVDDMEVLSKDRTILGIEVHIGRNRIVKRIFAHFGYEVIALDRVTYAGLDKKDLTRGKYRFLSEKEVIQLKFFK
jgi:23S rRNA pseudouridine2605 synthase